MTQELNPSGGGGDDRMSEDFRLVVERAPVSADALTQEALFTLLAAMQARTEFRHERDRERVELLASLGR